MNLLPTLGERTVLGIAVRTGLIAASLSTVAQFGFGQTLPQRTTSSPIQHDLALVPEKPLLVTLKPSESSTLVLQLHAGLYSEIDVQQIQGMNQGAVIDPDGHASTPYTNDAGAGSVQRISIIPEKSGTFHLRFQSRERHISAILRVTLEPERKSEPRDVQIVEAEDLLNKAEWIRRKSNFKSFPNMPDPADVMAMYRQAFHLAEQAGDISLQRGSLIGEARYQIYRIAQYQQGVLTAERATMLPASDANIGQQALAWKTFASTLAFVDRYNESIAASRRAIALYKKSGDIYWQGIVLGNLADIYLEIGDTSKAIEAAQESSAMAQKISDDYGVAFTQMTIGEIYQGRGEYQQALSAYRKALNIATAIPYPQVEGEVWSDLGQLYSQLGDWERAADAYRHALPVLRKDDDAVNEIETLGHLGRLALHSGHPRSARAYFRNGLSRAQSQNLIREETFLKVGLAQTCMHLHCSQDPLQTLSQARDAARQIHQIDGEAAIDAAIGDVLTARHNNSGAMQAYRQSETLWNRIPNPSEVAAVEADIARLDVSLGQLQTAKLEIYNALHAIEASRSHIDSQELRTSYFTSKHRYYGLAIEILMRLDNMYPHRGYAEEAWKVAERARARTLLDDLQGDRKTSSPASRQLQQQRAALELKIQNAEDKLLRLGSSPAAISQAGKLQEQIHDMLLNIDQLEARIHAADPDYQSLTERNNLSVAQFSRTVLDPKTALLEYWLGSRHSYLWIVAQDGMRSFRLPGQVTLDALIHSYRQSMFARNQYVAGESVQNWQLRIHRSDEAAAVISRKLAAILLPPRLSPRIHRLLIVPDGSLFSMPFAALDLSPSKGASKYLIERYGLVYEPSAAIAEVLARRAPLAGDRRIAIFADPVYTDADARVKNAAAKRALPVSQVGPPKDFVGNFSDLPRLPASRREALAIRRIAGTSNTSLFLGFDAVPQKIETIDWKQYSVAHFATHAIVNIEHPEFSGIVLSMVHSNGTPADGVLWLHDIYRLNMPVSLVVLSGCQTADGKSIPGEGINGFSRAFLYAGANSVIGTLWDANDRSASELTQSFYRAFFKGDLPAAALRNAQLHMLASAVHRAPYFWAGFILEGDWRQR